MPEISFSISFSAVYLFLAAILSAIVSFFVYRVTIPAIPTWARAVLMILRATAVFFLFLLIGEPILSLLQRSTEPPETLVLIDNSRSMTIVDKSGVRSELLRSLLKAPAFEKLSEIGTVRYATFDSRARFLSSFSFDSLTFTGDATNLSQTLQQVKAEARSSNVRSLVIVSDGMVSDGPSPLFITDELQVPLFTIGVGDTAEQRDLVVRTVLSNSLTYTGMRVPVNVTVRSSGYSGQRVEVTLRDSSSIIDRQFLTLLGGMRDYSVGLSFVPANPGIHRYRVAVSELPDELTDQNNFATFFTKVLKSRMKILILASAPSADLAFVRRSLDHDPNLEVQSLVGQPNGEFRPEPLTNQLLNDHDCLILIGIPSSSTSTSSIQLIVNTVQAGKPLFFLGSRELDIARIVPLNSLLPVTFSRGPQNEIQAFVQIAQNQKNHGVLKQSSPNAWNSLPPLFQLQYEIRAKPEAQVLAYSRVQNLTTTTPLLALRSVGNRKAIVCTAYGIWRWKMLSDKPTTGVLDEFMSNSIRWLTTRDDNRNIRVVPASDFFSSQDPIIITGQVYDESYEPVDDAHITVSLKDAKHAQEIALLSLGSGQYSGQIDNLPEGDYSFSASIQRDGVSIGRETGSFSVGDRALEFLDTKANKVLLHQLATRAGGSYFDPSEIDRLPDAIEALPSFQSREIVQSADLELWSSQWTLYLLLLLFSAEWFVRKRFTMV